MLNSINNDPICFKNRAKALQSTQERAMNGKY